MNKNRLRVSVGPLTNTIYAGQIKNGLWSGEKDDVTIDCLVAVSQHVLRFGKPVVITKENGTPEFEITVKKLEV